jgi:hypothetical protein
VPASAPQVPASAPQVPASAPDSALGGREKIGVESGAGDGGGLRGQQTRDVANWAKEKDKWFNAKMTGRQLVDAKRAILVAQVCVVCFLYHLCVVYLLFIVYHLLSNKRLRCLLHVSSVRGACLASSRCVMIR